MTDADVKIRLMYQEVGRGDVLKNLASIQAEMARLDSTMAKLTDTDKKHIDQLTGATNKELSLLERLEKEYADLLTARNKSNDVKTFAAYNDKLEEQKGKIDQLTGATNKHKDSSSSLGNVLTGVGGIMAGMFAVDRIMAFGKEVLDTAGKFERYKVVLTNAMGSEQLAIRSMKEIETMAANTRFSVDELTDGYLKMVNRGLKPSMAEMTKMADIAASQGKSFDQLVEAALDATTGEFERLKEFGISASKSGDQVTLAFKGVNKVVQNTPEAIQKAVLSFGELEGVVGANAKSMQTYEGMVSNMGDAYTSVTKKVGNLFAESAKESVGWTTGVLTGLGTILDEIKPVSSAFSEYFKIGKEGFDEVVGVIGRVITVMTGWDGKTATTREVMQGLGYTLQVGLVTPLKAVWTGVGTLLEMVPPLVAGFKVIKSILTFDSLDTIKANFNEFKGQVSESTGNITKMYTELGAQTKKISSFQEYQRQGNKEDLKDIQLKINEINKLYKGEERKYNLALLQNNLGKEFGNTTKDITKAHKDQNEAIILKYENEQAKAKQAAAAVGSHEKTKQSAQKSTTELKLANDLKELESGEKTYDNQVAIIKAKATLEIEQARQSLSKRSDFEVVFAAKKETILKAAKAKEELLWNSYLEKEKAASAKHQEELWKFAKEVYDKKKKAEEEYNKVYTAFQLAQENIEANRLYRAAIAGAKTNDERIKIEKNYTAQVEALNKQRIDFAIAHEEMSLVRLKKSRFASQDDIAKVEANILKLKTERLNNEDKLEEAALKKEIEYNKRREDIQKQLTANAKAASLDLYKTMMGDNFKALGAMGGEFMKFGENVNGIFKAVKDGEKISMEEIKAITVQGITMLANAYSAYSQDKHDQKVKELQEGLAAFNKAKDEELKGLEEKSKSEIEILKNKADTAKQLAKDAYDQKIELINSEYSENKAGLENQLALLKDSYNQQTMAINDAFNTQKAAITDRYDAEIAGIKAAYNAKQAALSAEVETESKNIEVLDTLRNGYLDRWLSRTVTQLNDDREKALKLAQNAEESAAVNLKYDELVAKAHNDYEAAKLDKNQAVKLATEQLRFEEKETSIKLKTEETAAIKAKEDEKNTAIVTLTAAKDVQLNDLRVSFQASETKMRDDIKALDAKHNQDLADIKKTYTDSAKAMETSLKDQILKLENQVKEDKSRIEKEKAAEETIVKRQLLKEDYENKKNQLWMNYVSAVASAFGQNWMLGLAVAAIAGAYFSNLESQLTSAYYKADASLIPLPRPLSDYKPDPNSGINMGTIGGLGGVGTGDAPNIGPIGPVVVGTPSTSTTSGTPNVIPENYELIDKILEDSSQFPDKYAISSGIEGLDGHEKPQASILTKDGKTKLGYEIQLSPDGKDVFWRTVPKFYEGGEVTGMGYPDGIDTVPILANKGEYVLTKNQYLEIGKGTTGKDLVEAWRFYEKFNNVIPNYVALNAEPMPVPSAIVNVNGGLNSAELRDMIMAGMANAFENQPKNLITHDERGTTIAQMRGNAKIEKLNNRFST